MFPFSERERERVIINQEHEEIKLRIYTKADYYSQYVT
jgi:hypothetical protein